MAFDGKGRLTWPLSNICQRAHARSVAWLESTPPKDATEAIAARRFGVSSCTLAEIGKLRLPSRIGGGSRDPAGPGKTDADQNSGLSRSAEQFLTAAALSFCAQLPRRRTIPCWLSNIFDAIGLPNTGLPAVTETRSRTSRRFDSSYTPASTYSNPKRVGTKSRTFLFNTLSGRRAERLPCTSMIWRLASRLPTKPKYC